VGIAITAKVSSMSIYIRKQVTNYTIERLFKIAQFRVFALVNTEVLEGATILLESAEADL